MRWWVGALRKHAGGMFLASDLGGYAAVASILILKVQLALRGWDRKHHLRFGNMVYRTAQALP
jgi:hypothetical protein